MAVPNTFGTATSAIPLSQLDANFNTPITLGNTAIQLGDTVTTLNNMTLANVTISSGTITITNVAVTTANVSGTANISTLVVVGNATVGGNTTITGNITAANANVTTNLVLSGGTANGVAYLNGSKVLTTGSTLYWDGTFFGVGTNGPNRKLYVQSDDSVTGGNVVGVRNSNATAGAFINFLAGGSNAPSIGSKGDDLVFNADGYNGTEWMRISNATGGVGAVGIGYTSLTSVGNNGLAVLGNVGIGTSSPAYKLDVSGYIRGVVSNASVGNASSAQFVQNSTGDAAISFLIGATTEWLAGVDNSDSDSFKINNITGGGDFTGTGITLDTSGNLLVGTTSATSPNPGIGMAVGGNAQITIGHDTTSASGQYYMPFKYNANVIGGVTQSGTTAVLYNVTSDYRLKENIVDAPEFGSVIDSLQVRSFDWKTDQTHQRAGFIAQELVTFAPEAVHQPVDEEEMMAVDYSKLVPMLVKEIQSLRKRLAALESA